MTEDEIYIAIEATIKNFTDVTEDNILRAYPGKRVPLPPNNNYVIMTFTGDNRTSTPGFKDVEIGEDGQEKEYKTILEQPKQGQIQIDFFGTKAKENATKIVDLARSYILCDYLKTYNIQPLYCDEASNMNFVSEEKEYVERWSITLDIAYQTKVEVNVDTFTSTELNILNNGDRKI